MFKGECDQRAVQEALMVLSGFPDYEQVECSSNLLTWQCRDNSIVQQCAGLPEGTHDNPLAFWDQFEFDSGMEVSAPYQLPYACPCQHCCSARNLTETTEQCITPT